MMGRDMEASSEQKETSFDISALPEMLCVSRATKSRSLSLASESELLSMEGARNAPVPFLKALSEGVGKGRNVTFTTEDATDESETEIEPFRSARFHSEEAKSYSTPSTPRKGFMGKLERIAEGLSGIRRRKSIPGDDVSTRLDRTYQERESLKEKKKKGSFIPRKSESSNNPSTPSASSSSSSPHETVRAVEVEDVERYGFVVSQISQEIISLIEKKGGACCNNRTGQPYQNISITELTDSNGNPRDCKFKVLEGHPKKRCELFVSAWEGVAEKEKIKDAAVMVSVAPRSLQKVEFLKMPTGGETRRMDFQEGSTTFLPSGIVVIIDKATNIDSTLFLLNSLAHKATEIFGSITKSWVHIHSEDAVTLAIKKGMVPMGHKVSERYSLFWRQTAVLFPTEARLWTKILELLEEEAYKDDVWHQKKAKKKNKVFSPEVSNTFFPGPRCGLWFRDPSSEYVWVDKSSPYHEVFLKMSRAQEKEVS